MKKILVIAAFALITNPCCSRAVNEDSVVSVYTTPTNAGPAQLDVYGQIATNIAEKISSPFYRLFGINGTEQQTTKRPFEHIEIQQSNSNRTAGRDVEELSAEALSKVEKKPEKITLFSSYLPVNREVEVQSDKLELNDTRNEVDSDFDDDDDFGFDEVQTPRGPFVYLLELAGSIIQLLWGGFLAIFKPSSS